MKSFFCILFVLIFFLLDLCRSFTSNNKFLKDLNREIWPTLASVKDWPSLASVKEHYTNKLIYTTQQVLEIPTNIIDKSPAKKSTPKLLYFGGAGLYFFWQAGCAKYLQEHTNVRDTNFVGASAGSLTSLLLLTEVDIDDAVLKAIKLTRKYEVFTRKTGVVGVLGAILREWLHDVVPSDVELAKTQLQVALTPFGRSPYLVSDFLDKDDIIEACLASCHIPLVLDGRPTVQYRGDKVIDGSFWYFVTKDRYTGLPLPKIEDKEDILFLEYCDDEHFMQTVSGNILEVSSVDAVREMMEMGYNYMKREDTYGRLNLQKNKNIPSSMLMKKVFSPSMTAKLYSSMESLRY